MLVGKREGSGEGHIIASTEENDGYYSGGWKDNMRFVYEIFILVVVVKVLFFGNVLVS